MNQKIKVSFVKSSMGTISRPSNTERFSVIQKSACDAVLFFVAFVVGLLMLSLCKFLTSHPFILLPPHCALPALPLLVTI